jgi:parallel beta-helix repeat protein
MPIRNNRFEGNGTGLTCVQFCSPVVTANAFDNNERGIYCVRSSSPSVEKNAFTGNGAALVAELMSNPKVRGNDFTGNRLAILLKMSSYARVNGNNFDNNDAQVRLEVMSHDWEIKAGKKPERGETARHLSMADKGKAIAGRGMEGVDPNAAAGEAGVVDATGNWWGERDTAEMAAKGKDGNIGSLVDGRDVPMQSYEGYPGEYAQDTIDFGGWKGSRISGTGIPGSGR